MTQQVSTYQENMREKAKQAEERIKRAIARGLPSEFIDGFLDYEQAILYFESVGKRAEALSLGRRLVRIMEVVDEKGDRDAPKFAKLGPFFILFANQFKARILERLNADLTEATAARVKALELAEGVEAIEQILQIMVNLLLEDHLDFGIRYLEYAREKKDELISEIRVQIDETKKGLFSKLFSGDSTKVATKIYLDFLSLLALMLERRERGLGFYSDAIRVLRNLRPYVSFDFSYLEERLLALEAKIRASSQDIVDLPEISHVPSRIIPHTILDDPKIKVLEDLIRKYLKARNYHGIDCKVSYTPVLGANPAGPPHLAVVGQTGSGKTTFARHVIKENRRIQQTATIIFDHHFEYADIADHIVQFGGEEQEEASLYYPLEELGETFEQAREFMQQQQQLFAQKGMNPEDLAAKMKTFQEQTRPMVRNFIIDAVEAVLEKDEDKIFPIGNTEEPPVIAIWVQLGDTETANIVIETIMKHLLQTAIEGRLKQKTILVNEEAQRLAGSQWVRSISSEGRKFGLFQISISQLPEFDPWVLSNSEVAIFRLRRLDQASPLADLLTPEIKRLITELEIGEYLSYDREKRKWFLGYNPESLTPMHAKTALENKIARLRKIV